MAPEECKNKDQRLGLYGENVSNSMQDNDLKTFEALQLESSKEIQNADEEKGQHLLWITHAGTGRTQQEAN